jgi:hypothetical protein
MSRKGPANAVTCRDGQSRVADLHEWPFGCFTFVPVDAAASPRKAPGNSHCPSPLFRLCAGHARARCGLVFVHRWSALNERQRALLERLAAGEDPAAWEPGGRRSAHALRDRGLLNVTRAGGEARAEATEAGRFHLRHGRHPDAPAFADRADQVVPAGTESSAAGGGRRGVTGRRRSPCPGGGRRLLRAVTGPDHRYSRAAAHRPRHRRPASFLAQHRVISAHSNSHPPGQARTGPAGGSGGHSAVSFGVCGVR